jgi:hypothetical protein
MLRDALGADQNLMAPVMVREVSCGRVQRSHEFDPRAVNVGFVVVKVTLWQGFRPVCKDAQSPLLALSCVSVCLYVRMYHRDSHWTDFHEIWYWRLMFKTCQGNSRSAKTKQILRPLYTKTKVSIFYVMTARYIQLSDYYYYFQLTHCSLQGLLCDLG